MTVPSNVYVTRTDGTEQTLYDVVFVGLQDGKLLFARPETLHEEQVEHLPKVAEQTFPVPGGWNNEGRQSVEVFAIGLGDVESIETDWSSLADEEGPLLTNAQAYEAAYRFVAQYGDREPESEDLGLLRVAMQPVNDVARTNDPASWEDWIECVRSVRNKDTLPTI